MIDSEDSHYDCCSYKHCAADCYGDDNCATDGCANDNVLPWKQ